MLIKTRIFCWFRSQIPEINQLLWHEPLLNIDSKFRIGTYALDLNAKREKNFTKTIDLYKNRKPKKKAFRVAEYNSHLGEIIQNSKTFSSD